MSYKFDEASYKDNSGNLIEPPLKLEYLIDEKKNDEKLFEQKYHRKLFCPECHTPQLSLVSSKNGIDFFLRGFKNQPHTNNCSYSFDSVNKTAISELLNNTDSREFINKKLKGLVSSLLKRQILKQNPLLVKTELDKISTDAIEKHDLRNQQNIKRLLTKSLTSPFDDDDYGTPKLFYGNVDIQFNKRTNSSSGSFFYSLAIFSRKTNNIVCSINMSESVFLYLKTPFAVKDDVKYTDVLVAVATTLNKNGSYVDGKISYSDYCVIDVI